MTLTLRSIAVSAALATTGVSAYADLTIPFQGTQSNSVQAFSEVVLGAFDLMAITVEAKGNASAIGTDGVAYNFPVTKIVIGSKLNIVSGSAVGSALKLSRQDKGATIGVTLANFTIDYNGKRVLADTTPIGGQTTAQMPLYNFQIATPLALKYRFPLTITGHEVLNDLRLTPEAKAVMKTALNLPVFAQAALEEDYGTLTQDVSTTVRKPAASTAPYVAQ
ncbi:MAG: hypothetical protein QM742_15195 [Aquabacterium sp.]